MKLFGTSGIRGKVNVDITPQLGICVGQAIGTLYESVIIGYDTRTSNLMLTNAIQSGVLCTGADLYHAGLVTTPTLGRATRNFKCGLMVTASHNPPEYNGIKFWNPDGSAFDDVQSKSIEDFIETENYRLVQFDKIGRIENYTTAISEHVDSILSKVSDLNLRVVIDCGNGSASTITPIIFRKLGCEVVTINSQPDGYFPGRNPEPTEDNLQLLKNTVINLNADIGIAHDGDADRMVAIDDKGTYISGDKLLAFFGLHDVQRKIVIPVDTSMVVESVLCDKTVIRTRVGDVYVAQTLKKENADFGGEPSGTWIFPKETYCPDGIYAAVRLAEIIKTERKRLSELMKVIPTYPMRRYKLRFDESYKDEIKLKLDTELESLGEVSKIDGWRVRFDNGWFLVRFSGTEPYVRITVEADSVENTDKLCELAVKTVERCLM
jgi:phosphoglucosamine mutase